MSTLINFPQGPIVGPTGYITLEWQEWLQNPQVISINFASAISPTSGGTGLTSYTTGDLLYASATDTLNQLNDVATGNALISGGVGVAPSWGKITLTGHVSGTLPEANGGTGITALGTGIATFLGTPSSANLAAAVTDETGSGALVFATSPALTTPNLGTPSAGVLTNCTGLPTGGITGGISVTITTAALTGGGTTGTMTFTNGVLTAQTPAT